MEYVMPEWANDLYINEERIPFDWDVVENADKYYEYIQAQLVGEFLEKTNKK